MILNKYYYLYTPKHTKPLKMKATYKVRLTPHPIIIRVQDETEEIIFDKKHLKIHRAEKICKDLNHGITINWDNLN